MVKKVIEKKGEIRKLKWIGRKDAPDRVVFLNGVFFIELKASNKKARSSQEREHKRMRDNGAIVYVINCNEDVDYFINEICTERLPGA